MTSLVDNHILSKWAPNKIDVWNVCYDEPYVKVYMSGGTGLAKKVTSKKEAISIQREATSYDEKEIDWEELEKRGWLHWDYYTDEIEPISKTNLVSK